MDRVMRGKEVLYTNPKICDTALRVFTGGSHEKSGSDHKTF